MFTEIASHVSIKTPYAPFLPITNRKEWESLSQELKTSIIADGERYLLYTYPVLPMTDFMTFSRTGNRKDYEDKLFSRRIALNALTLAECVEHKGRFLDQIINGIFLICEETAWQLPAHNSYIRDSKQLLLPDVNRPVIDLFAAETAAVLGITDYLLRDLFSTMSPAISLCIKTNLQRRIFSPYLNEHFWWMGDGQSPMNNWTVWCTQNVLLAAFTDGSDILSDQDQAKIFSKACQSLDYFLDEYGNDGCCDEGAQYYRHAGLCLFNNIELLNGITGSAFQSLYKETKIKNIASYILHAHIDGPYYVNFADCSPLAGRCNAREYLFGKRTENDALMAFAAKDYLASELPIIPDEHNLFYRLQMVFTHKELISYPFKEKIIHPDIYYESVGLFAARDSHLYLAVKAGDNDDSHNHNDTGSFIIYKDGKPVFIDVGVETYTQKTFSPNRYEIWTMQSQYHNLPTIGAVVQKSGSAYKAHDVSYHLSDTNCWISMNIADAYSDTGILSYQREAVLYKNREIVITDTYTGSIHPVVLSLMTYEKPKVDGKLIDIGGLVSCKIDGADRISVEEIPITDARLKTAWAHPIYRLLVTMKKNQLTLTIRLFD